MAQCGIYSGKKHKFSATLKTVKQEIIVLKEIGVQIIGMKAFAKWSLK